MKANNFIRRIDKRFIYNNYVNTFVDANSDTIIFNHEGIVYSPVVNNYLNHEERSKFLYNDIVKSEKNGIFNDNSFYINQIFDIDKVYFIKRDDSLYCMYFYKLDNGGVLINYHLPEIEEKNRILNRKQLENFLSKLYFVKEKELKNIELPDKNTLNTYRDSAKKKTLINNLGNTNDYNYFGYDMSNGSYLFMKKKLCIQNNKNKCYIISISYNDDNKFEVKYKISYGVKIGPKDLKELDFDLEVFSPQKILKK